MIRGRRRSRPSSLERRSVEQPRSVREDRGSGTLRSSRRAVRGIVLDEVMSEVG